MLDESQNPPRELGAALGKLRHQLGWVMGGVRRRYAQKHSLPLPDTTSAAGSKDIAGAKKTCIDVCAEFGGVQDCQTRCVHLTDMRFAPPSYAKPLCLLSAARCTGRCVRIESEKKHACREACQGAFSSACDRAFPPTSENGPHNYKTCLQYLEASCKDTCQAY